MPNYPIRIDLDKAKKDTAVRDANKRTPKEEAEKKAMEKKYPFNKYAKGGGIETKGKTKGKMIKMAKGGAIDGIAMKGKTRCKGAK